MTYLKFGLTIVISLSVLLFLFTKVPFEQIIAIVKRSQIQFFVLSVFVAALSVVVNAIRWQVLLKYLGYKYGLNLLSRLSFITFFLNIYVPVAIAGDVMRVAILPADEKGSKEDKNFHLTRVTASVVTDRLVGMAGIMILAFIGLFFCYKLLLNSKILPIFGLTAFGIVTGFLVLFSRRIQNIIKRVFNLPVRILSPIKNALKEVSESLFVYRDNYSVFKKVIPISILSQLCVVLYFYLLAISIDVEINFAILLLFVSIIEFVSTIPISFGGIGIREAATIIMFSSAGIKAPEAMTVSLLSFVVIMIVGAAGGFIYLYWHIDRKNDKKLVSRK